MGKFNKGDRVKALVNGVDYKAGDEFVLTADGNGKSVYFDDNAGDDRMRPQEEFELLPVADNKPAFKVGDRVRLIKDGQSTTGAVGKLATIESWGDKLIDNGQYLLNIDGPVDYQTHAVTPNYTRASPDCFELAPATLTIEAGKFYRTRDGRKVGPMERGGMRSFPWLGENASDGFQSYRNDGSWELEVYEPSCHDLIAEWVDESVGQDTNDDTPPVAEQQEAGRFVIRADVIGMNLSPNANSGSIINSTLLRTKQGYGFEIARHGDYVWVDTGQKAPIVLKTADVQAAA